MDFKDALRALADGKGIRRLDWRSDEYIYIANNGVLNDMGIRIDLGKATHVQAEWELYTPPAVKKTLTLWRRPWCEIAGEWFQPNYRESKKNAIDFQDRSFHKFGWKFHGEWESIEVEVEA